MKNFLFIFALALATLLQAKPTVSDEPVFRFGDEKTVIKIIDPELRALIKSSTTNLNAGGTNMSDIIGYIQGFDDLLAKHKGEKTEAAAQVLYAKFDFIYGVLGDDDTGDKVLHHLAMDYPETKLGKGIGKIIKKNEVGADPDLSLSSESPWIAADPGNFTLSPSRTFVLSNDCFLTPFVCSSQSNLVLATPKLGHTKIHDGAFLDDYFYQEGLPHLSQDGGRLLVRVNPSTLRLVDTRTQKPVGVPLTHPARVFRGRFSPDNQLFATICDDGRVRLWQTKDGQAATPPLETKNAPLTFVFSGDSTRLCVIASNSVITVWDVRTGRPVGKSFQCGEGNWEQDHASTGSWTVFSPDGRILLDGIGPYWLWNVETGTRRTNAINHNDKIFAMVFSPDSKRVVTTAGCDERCARVWNAQTGLPLTPSLRHLHSVFTADFLPDGRRFVTTSLDKRARIWDSTNGKLLAVFINPEADVPLAKFSPDGQYLFTTGGRVVRLWSTTTGQMLVKPIELSGEGKEARFSADSKSIQTVTDARLVQIWDLIKMEHPDKTGVQPSDQPAK